MNTGDPIPNPEGLAPESQRGSNPNPTGILTQKPVGSDPKIPFSSQNITNVGVLLPAPQPWAGGQRNLSPNPEF